MKTNEELERKIDNLHFALTTFSFVIIILLCAIFSFLLTHTVYSQDSFYNKDTLYSVYQTREANIVVQREKKEWIAPCKNKIGVTLFTWDAIRKCMNDLYFDWRRYGKRRKTIMEIERMDGLE